MINYYVRYHYILFLKSKYNIKDRNSSSLIVLPAQVLSSLQNMSWIISLTIDPQSFPSCETLSSFFPSIYSICSLLGPFCKSLQEHFFPSQFIHELLHLTLSFHALVDRGIFSHCVIFLHLVSEKLHSTNMFSCFMLFLQKNTCLVVQNSPLYQFVLGVYSLL